MRRVIYVFVVLLLLASCKSGKTGGEEMYEAQRRVTGNFKNITAYKTLAILPAQIRFNSRHPKTVRTEKRSKLAIQNEEKLMYHDYEVFSAHPERLMIRLQSPDSTMYRLRNAGISIDDLPYIDRQRLLEVLQVDALMEHQIDVNVYASTTEDVVTSTAILFLLAGAASMGGIPSGTPSKENSYASIEFMKVYGKGAERPVWSYFGNSDYTARKVPKIKRNSLDRFRALGFPFLR